jgi:glycosyltransferase involved in cell wall biosynthesis
MSLVEARNEYVTGLVSVVMNCYNGQKYVREAIDSVLAQTYQNWELVFWDNHSTDRSAEIFKGYSDSRFRYFLAPHHTVLYAARDLAIQQIRGQFIAFLDIDDWWTPDKLSLQIPLFDDLEVGLVYGNYCRFNQNKRVATVQYRQKLPVGWIRDAILQNYVIGMLTMVVRKSALDDLGKAFDPRFQVIGDFEFAVRMAKRYKIGCVQRPVAYYRWHDSNMSTTERDRSISELELWMTEAELPAESLKFVRYGVVRSKIIRDLHTKNYAAAIRNIRNYPISLLKLRLLSVLARHFSGA